MLSAARPVRVLQLVQTLQRRGVERIVCAIALRLHGHGYRIDVCCQTAKGPLEDALRERGIRVYCLNQEGPRDLAAAWRLLSLLRGGQYDILHTHCPSAAGFQFPVARMARVPKVVCTLHATPGLPGPPGVRAKTHLRRRLASLMSRRIDWMYGCSAAVLRTEQMDGWHGAGSSVIYNGIDLDRLRPRAGMAAAKAAWGIGAETPVIGSVGSLSPEKGHVHLIRALPLIRARVPGACLLLVGTGPGAAQLAGLARACGCAGAVRFLGERENVQECIHAMDVFVLPSLAEGFGLALVEAMACGVPTVSSSVGGVPEIVSDGVSGLLVPPGDHQALAAAAVRILMDARLARSLSSAAIATVNERFDEQKMARSVNDLYGKLFNQTVAGARREGD